MNEYLQKAKEVLTILKMNGYQAYLVGGFVRDYLLGIESGDIDITTSATPEEVIALFPKVKETGKKYGTVTVFMEDFTYEVTTFREDGIYKNNRHPESVRYSKEVKHDLERRDFTVNALIMDENDIVTDYHNGKDDLSNKTIRTINNPRDRFNEDALRILRAFRFVSKLGFEIEKNTLEAIKELKHLIDSISIERVMTELEKIFEGAYRTKAIQYMLESKVSEELFGIEKGLEALQTIDVKLDPLEAFIICFAKSEFSEKWRFSNKNFRIIEATLNLHDVTKDNEFNKFILFSNGLEICLRTNRINVLLGYHDQEEALRKMYQEMPVHDVCDLAYKGQHILEDTNLRQRSIIGLVIDELLYNVIMGILPNDYEVLKEFSLKKISQLQKEMGYGSE